MVAQPTSCRAFHWAPVLGGCWGEPADTRMSARENLGGHLGELGTTSCASHVGLPVAKAAGLLDPVPHHGPYGDQYSDSGHNAERNGEDCDPEDVAVLPRLQGFPFGVLSA